MMSKSVRSFVNSNILVETLASSVCQKLRSTLLQKERASLMLSGGSTPKKFLNRLSQCELDWSRIDVGLSDERWVSPDDLKSNERFMRENFLINKAKEANFVGMYIDGLSVFEAQQDVQESIKNQLYPFDVVMLGMGLDGHTASLFPKTEELKDALSLKNSALCSAVKLDDEMLDRMSLTREAILSAKNIYIHFEGKDKIDVYNQALEGDDIYEMPIRSILQEEQNNIEVYFA